MKKFFKIFLMLTVCFASCTVARPALVLANEQGCFSHQNQFWFTILSCLRNFEKVLNSDTKKAEEFKSQFRAELLSEFGGKEPGFFAELRRDANELLKKAKELVKKSDEAGVEPQDFHDFTLQYLKENCGQARVCSRKEFIDFCSKPNKLQVYFDFWEESSEEVKEKKRKLFDGRFFELAEDYCYHGKGDIDSRFSAYHALGFHVDANLYGFNRLAYETKHTTNGSEIKFDVGPGVPAQVEGAIDLNEIKEIESEDLLKIKNVLFYDNPELFDVDSLKFSTYLNRLFYFNSSSFKLVNEAFKKTFGCDISKCFDKFSSDFDKPDGGDRKRVLDDFSAFVSRLTRGYKPLQEELEKLLESCDKKFYIENKLLAVLDDNELCARLLGYQAVVSGAREFKDHYYAIIDPGCLVLCGEQQELPDKTLKDIYEADGGLWK